MKVALMIPEYLSGMSFRQQPLGMLYAATFLKDKGFESEIIDMRTTHTNELLLLKTLDKYDVIILTSTPYDQVQNFYVDYRLAYTFSLINKVKKRYPDKDVVLCGSHGTVRHDLVFDRCNIDIIIKGEYEQAIPIVVEALANKNSLSEVPNIVYKEEGKIIESSITKKPDELLFNFDRYPDYDKIEMSRYFGDGYWNNMPYRELNWGVIQGSRGCPYKCSFCYKFWGNKFRKRQPESIVGEMQLLNEKYFINNLFFIDYTFTYDKKWVLSICDLILKNALKINWTIETRIDKLDEEIVKNLSISGCKNIWLGIESFDDNILQKCNKNYSAEIIPSQIELLNKYNIKPHIFIMLGLPGETVSSLNHMLKMIHRYKLPYTKSIITSTPRYGTEYYNQAVQQYPEIENDWYKLNKVKGIVANEVNENIIDRVKSIMSNRDFVNLPFCPQI
jgi:anaerobic magnesium-protoporphyrin IX monomethyl ester cyclase